MNRPIRQPQMSRRRFLGGLAAAPVAARTGVLRELLAKVDATAALSGAGVAVGEIATPSYGVHTLVHSPTLMALHKTGMLLHKTGMLPSWIIAEVEESTEREVSGRIAPDVFVLRSVSLGSKMRIHKERTMRRVWASVDYQHGIAIARRAFYDQPNGSGGPYPPR